MGQTHQEITKVWIEDGCIVCDACETESPTVFEVLEDSCIIRPSAQSPDFTKPLTPTIIDAADGCPVDVIHFETVDVEGPEPWAGQEEAAAEGVPTGGGAKKAGGTVIPDGPPDPKWAGLLQTAESRGGKPDPAPAPSQNTPRPAKAPAEAIVAALPENAPPDAKQAAMVGSGFTKPRSGVRERIDAIADRTAETSKVTRRQFVLFAAGGWAFVIATLGTWGAAIQSFMVPKVTKEPPSSFRAGKLSDFPEPGVYEQFKPQGVWLVYLEEGKLVALSTTCTHLGCIPNWLNNDRKFKCPCHGSGFYVSGIHFEGPAPRPLERLKIIKDGEWIVVDKSKTFREELGQWDQPGAFLTV